ncbi:Chondroitin polymerase [Actinomyces bovis]|uniref:Chondroitin polymerase n=1 Tax=Actinomyces bovis TaxID=1658 RepID=A0ABY1VNS4_9ACTO|nr:glycosyltransferase family 2 protein [Actinomyces bovis]SPT53756.1 Chondroitin polymerase [Actinomyces bovis]VEG53084.1 Chondroitin polymerase [Actinomyces israelii]
MAFISPLVSCIIPTYRRTETLSRAIASAVKQTYPHLEILVVDDNPCGSSFSATVAQIVDSYASCDRVVKLITQRKHINGAAARNAGVAAANGEFIAFLDDDDEWLERKVELQVAKLCADPMVGGVTCLYVVKKNGLTVRECHPYDSNDLQFRILLREVSLFTPTFLCRKSLFEAMGGFNEALERHQDLQLFADFMSHAAIEPLNEVLVVSHCDSTINAPCFNDLVKIKAKFFEIERPTLRNLGWLRKRRIYAAHRFELAFVAAKERKWWPMFKCVVPTLFNPIGWHDLRRRMLYRSR